MAEAPRPHLSDYELARDVVIARNRARLEQLGIAVAATALKAAAPAPKKRAPPAERPLNQHKGPVRKSRRLQAQSDEPEEEVKEEDEAAEELGAFIVNGRCPKCAKVVTKGHKKHLAMCTGKPVYDPSLSKLIEVAVNTVHSDDEKLNALELGGLIQVDEHAAAFIVHGSTGKHYKVQLADTKHTCQCIDHRIRRHDCKHIKLLLKLLGMPDNGKPWRSAVQDMILQQDIGAGDQKPQPPEAKPK